MSNITTKKMQALEACEKVINGVEDGLLSEIEIIKRL